MCAKYLVTLLCLVAAMALIPLDRLQLEKDYAIGKI